MTKRLLTLLIILIILISATVYASRDRLSPLWSKITASPPPPINQVTK